MDEPNVSHLSLTSAIWGLGDKGRLKSCWGVGPATNVAHGQVLQLSARLPVARSVLRRGACCGSFVRRFVGRLLVAQIGPPAS